MDPYHKDGKRDYVDEHATRGKFTAFNSNVITPVAKIRDGS